MLVLYVLRLLGRLLAFFAWVVIIVIGRLPQGLFEVMELPQRYQLRVTAYLLLAHRRLPLVPGGDAARSRSVDRAARSRDLASPGWPATRISI